MVNHEQRFILRCKLSTNHRPRRGPGWMHLADDYTLFMSSAVYEIRQQMPFTWIAPPKSSVLISLGANYTRGDLDNYLKGLLDACVTAGVWPTDSQTWVARLAIARAENQKASAIIAVHW